MFEWSDDDEVPVAPPPSMKAPPRSTRVEEQLMRGEEAPQQRATEVPEQRARGAPERQAEEVPEQLARGALERRAEEVPEQQPRGAPERRVEERPTAETAGPPPQDAGVDPKAAVGGSSRHRRFKEALNRNKNAKLANSSILERWVLDVVSINLRNALASELGFGLRADQIFAYY